MNVFCACACVLDSLCCCVRDILCCCCVSVVCVSVCCLCECVVWWSWFDMNLVASAAQGSPRIPKDKSLIIFLSLHFRQPYVSRSFFLNAFNRRPLPSPLFLFPYFLILLQNFILLIRKCEFSAAIIHFLANITFWLKLANILRNRF